MNFEEMSELNEKFAEEFKQMTEEFYGIFEKWKNKSVRLTCVAAMHLPINLIMSLIASDKNSSLPRIFPELPDMFERFFKPFFIIKEHWGKVSCQEFTKLYAEEYEKQFTRFFASEQAKKKFSEWFEADTKKHKKKIKRKQ